MRRSLILLLALALAGCGLPAGTAQRLSFGSAFHARSLRGALDSEQLYPLVTGWQWRYQTTSRQGAGPDRPGPSERFVIREVQQATDSTQAVMDRFYGAQPYPSTQIVRSAASVNLSVYQHPEQGSINILRFPLSVQAAWPGRTWGQVTETIVYAGTESLTVPAGSFVAARTDHHIHYPNGNEDQLHYWYAPGVGMIKAVEGLTVDLGQGPQLNQVTAVLTAYGTGSITP